MDYRKCAQEIFQQVGGRENLVSAAHCATRLRLVIADNNKLNMKALENIDGVKGVFSNAGQLQLILGTGTVNKVYDEFLAVSGMTAATKEEVKAAAAARQPLPKRMVKALGDVFVPILPAIVASGLIMGLLEGLCKAFPALADSGAYTIFHLFSNAAFVFLPILVAISAARVFGGNIFLGAVIGMIMIHTDLVNAWSVADYVANGTPIPSADVWFGLYNINLTGYQGHVIPVIIAVWIMCQIEKRLHKIVPEMLDLFITPLVTVCVTGYLTLTIFGPVFSTVENWVLTGVQMLITIPFGIGAALMGAIYPLTVVCGVHHMYNVIEAGMLSSTGLNTCMPIASAANFAQGAACLAVALKTRDRKTKALALPSAMSAALGITEPAIFGVNLRLVKPLIAGMIGGAAGSVVGSMFHIGATAYGVTGLFGFLTTTDYLVPYAIELAVSFAVAFAVSWFLYKEEAPAAADTAPQVGEQPALSTQSGVVGCPMAGKVIPMADIPDATFAAGVLGEGCGIEPAEGRVVAPFDGVVTTVADTRHALGLSSPDGMELLIHVGINTVELAGEGFTLHCAEGDTVKAGQVLLDVDLDRIRKGGYSTTTAVLLTNAEDLGEPTVALGQHREGEPILTIPAAVPAK
ncbi:PTS beta-glucoside transporter subunit EIIBCA [Flavonifractor sp. An92]|uniref:PTS beta-glucoside transporter subunit IIBCA n=1 Tax=Flavonifractor sp. An92 TaxID=1965666 RepID=UPI000B3A5537|nr:PTS transporter subunit IIBCA [Flavonifractor sp. An92]OUN03686.1 PTS beta-glucoside transporter subunit EIIBCA [Flavonifractor sp. An92]